VSSTFHRPRRPSSLSPVPDLDRGGNWDESTAVAGYDDVTQQVAVADLAALVAQAQPTRAVPVLRRPTRVAQGTAERPSPRRRRRIGLGIFILLTAGAIWAMAVYEAWYFFLK
jgi:hypothetical protein